jgi:hypothetical protein
MFGAVEDDFYGLVGRITLVSALLEDRLYVLYCQLARRPPDELATTTDTAANLSNLAGKPGTVIINESRKLLHRFWPDRRDEAEAFLTGSASALRGRHEIVHSLWPFSKPEPVRGWRHAPPGRRQEPDRPVEWTSLTADQLPELLTELVLLVGRCYQVEGWVQLA